MMNIMCEFESSVGFVATVEFFQDLQDFPISILYVQTFVCPGTRSLSGEAERSSAI